MKGLKYLAYAVPCCMALTGTSEGIVFAGMAAVCLAFILD